MRHCPLPTALAAVLAASLLLAACGSKDAGDAPLSAADLKAEPTDSALAPIYDSSCKLCHANPASGAPLAGDHKAWAPRVAQGADTLLDHTINGYQGMPPMGMCMQCDEDQFIALIEFMSGAKLEGGE
ncbi:c-type cytochrome [Solimonas soli]|uniref:c-type cytochrome n=1 Tax=Solimonas soli TaxID=413479 RepID=UPI0004820190|nr:c-type cytochrome [Solimonas soli]